MPRAFLSRSMSGIMFGLASLILLVSALLSDSTRLWTGLKQQWPIATSTQHWYRTTGESKEFFRHLGGNGPWVAHGVDHTNRCPLPSGCSVVQAHLISRHAERYPTLNAGRRHVALLRKLNSSTSKLSGSLSFAKQWSYFTDLNDPKFENLTTTGPYAGTLQAYTTGQRLRKLYDHLVPKYRPLNLWTCGSPRDIETARHYADGFFGSDWEIEQRARLHIIPESADRGGDTLTPGRSCRRYRDDKVNGRDLGYEKLAEFQEVMARSIGKRLQIDAEGLQFTPLEIYGMMELCGFEILVRGSSPWCEIFTGDEWSHYEYARDLLHFYRAGPGNPYAGVLGWLWLNATTEQLVNGSASGIYHSFVHDGDIIPLLTTLGIFNQESTQQILRSDRTEPYRRWKTSDVVPMGGRLVFERIDCKGKTSGADSIKSHVRLIVNDGLFDLGQFVGAKSIACSTALDVFQQWVSMKEAEFGDFRTKCGISHDLPGRISFLHQ